MDSGLSVETLELWRGDRRLLADLSFTAPPGTLVHVAGQNGVGKTTMLRAVCGLTHPESGSINWYGGNIHDDLSSYHAEIAWLGHRDGLRPELTARENLVIAHRLHGRRAGDVDRDLEDAAATHLSGLPVRSLSAGQKKRIALIRIFTSGARLWLLDEPFANLDADGREWGLARVRRHVAGGGICALSTHLSFAGDDVVRLELGR